jgi:hypothetical protein
VKAKEPKPISLVEARGLVKQRRGRGCSVGRKRLSDIVRTFEKAGASPYKISQILGERWKANIDPSVVGRHLRGQCTCIAAALA